MKGHVRKRGNKWCFVLDIGYDDTTGKRKQKWFSGYRTKKDAEKAMAEKVNEINQGTFVEPSKERFGKYMDQWLESKKPSYRPSTYETHYHLINKHIKPSLGRYALSKLNSMHIERLYGSLREKGLKESSMLKIHNIIKTALKRAKDRGYVAKNVAEAVDAPRVRKAEMQYWDEQQVRTFLHAAKSDRLYTAFVLAISTGMRRGEILGLQWKDIDFEAKQIQVRRSLSPRGVLEEPKTSSSIRTISIDDWVVSQLKTQRISNKEDKLKAGPELYHENEMVICTRFGTPVSPRNMERSFKRLTSKLDVPKIRLHDLRHTHATLLLKQGVHVKIVSERLGHSNIRITLDTYSHVLPGLQEEAAQKFGESIFGVK